LQLIVLFTANVVAVDLPTPWPWANSPPAPQLRGRSLLVRDLFGNQGFIEKLHSQNLTLTFKIMVSNKKSPVPGIYFQMLSFPGCKLRGWFLGKVGISIGCGPPS